MEDFAPVGVQRHRLINPLERTDIEKGCEFEIEEQDEEFTDDRFDTEEYLSELSNATEALSICSGNGVSTHGDGPSPFATYIDDNKNKLLDLSQDGGVLKSILQQGEGDVISTGSVAVVHYNAYIELADEPFDSTRLRQDPLRFRVADVSKNEDLNSRDIALAVAMMNMIAMDVVEGLHMGVSTMKKREIARLFVDYEYAWGASGIPPRIPAKTRVMFEVELINFVECAEADQYYSLSHAERKRAPFELVRKAADTEAASANVDFQQEHYTRAKAKYLKAINILTNVSVANQQEDDDRQAFLLRLHRNRAICALHLDQPRLVITESKNALSYDPNCAKAMYLRGKAYMLLGELQEAEVFLMKAKALRPKDNAINKTIAKLDEKMRRCQENEEFFCRRMFNSDKAVEQRNESATEKGSGSTIMKTKLEEFCQMESREWNLPGDGLTNDEIETLIGNARSLNLHIDIHDNDNKKEIRITKS